MPGTLPENYQLLDEAETRAMLRCSRSSLYRLMKRGKLKRSSASVGRSLFTLADIQRLIATPLEREAA